jgi:hypothetical protein
MPTLRGSRAERNLLAAFAEEPQARNRCACAARMARLDYAKASSKVYARCRKPYP